VNIPQPINKSKIKSFTINIFTVNIPQPITNHISGAELSKVLKAADKKNSASNPTKRLQKRYKKQKKESIKISHK
jgi:hypothetical protein